MTPSERALLRIADLWEDAERVSDYLEFHMAVGDIMEALGLLSHREPEEEV